MMEHVAQHTHRSMQTSTSQDDSRLIDTRFGAVEIDPAQAIDFPQCMVGIEEKHRYCIADLPSRKLARFKLLQSLDDDSLSFLMLPISLDNPFISREHISEACENMDIPLQQLQTLLVVSIQRVNSLVSLTVNARAPVMIDTLGRRGYQCVLRQSHYDIRQPLSL